MTALYAEWTKLRTVPGTLWLFLGTIVSTTGVGAFAAATMKCLPGECILDPARTSLTGVILGQTIVAILAVLTIGGEYSTGMIRTSLTANPRRTTVLAAKATVVAAVTLAAGALAVLASLLAARMILPGRGIAAMSLTDGTVVRAALGSVLYLGLIALLSLGIATGVRDSATGIGVVLALLYLFPLVSLAVSDLDWRRHLGQIAPMSAGLAVQTTTDLRNLPIGPWAGLGVLAAWAAGALLLGGLSLHLRDA
jgi:ABC-2 type transport system permease protein